MFLVNSRLRFLRCVPLSLRFGGKAYPEVTPINLPSSFTNFHSFTLAVSRQPTCVGLRYDSHFDKPKRWFSGKLAGLNLSWRTKTFRQSFHPLPCGSKQSDCQQESNNLPKLLSSVTSFSAKREVWNINQIVHRLRLSAMP